MDVITVAESDLKRSCGREREIRDCLDRNVPQRSPETGGAVEVGGRLSGG